MMHLTPTLMIKFCFDRAAQCRQGAEQALDPSRRQSWLDLEGRWFFLARSYDNERRVAAMPPTLRSRLETKRAQVQ
jgi:hypothetical protein